MPIQIILRAVVKHHPKPFLEHSLLCFLIHELSPTYSSASYQFQNLALFVEQLGVNTYVSSK